MMFRFRIPTLLSFLAALLLASWCHAFAPSPLTRRPACPGPSYTTIPSLPSVKSSSTSLHSFLGSDGGILGVGAPEVFTILLVGYFVLGPSDLYKLVKAIGAGVQNLRTLSSDVSKTFESNMENQLQLEELRKAQRELNDAFSFRRSINVDQEAEAFTTSSSTTTMEEESTTTTTSTATDAPKKRKKRRRVKKKKVEVEQEEANGGSLPDLDMPDLEEMIREEREELGLEEELELRQERMERLKTGTQPSTAATRAMEDTGSSAQEQERFAQQLSGQWNESILNAGDKLEPLAKVMERLAILQEEKQAAEARLEEEFRLKAELEKKYYQDARALLEETAAQVQAQAYVPTMKEDDSNAKQQQESSSASSKK